MLFIEKVYICGANQTNVSLNSDDGAKIIINNMLYNIYDCLFLHVNNY